jgi:hypothetical protein
MLSLPELLRRFRRVWLPPGAALARVAPPVDVSARLRAEVAPVFEAVAEIERRAAAIRAAADEEGTALVDSATREAAEAVRKAETEAPAARSAAAERKWHTVEGDIETALTAARTEAARIEDASGRRMAELVERVRACVMTGEDLGS